MRRRRYQLPAALLASLKPGDRVLFWANGETRGEVIHASPKMLIIMTKEGPWDFYGPNFGWSYAAQSKIKWLLNV